MTKFAEYRYTMRFLVRVMIFESMLLITGCADTDYADLESFVAEVKQRQKGVIDPLPEIKTVEPFVFNIEDLRDPFELDEKVEPQEEVKSENGLRPDTSRSREELESYELDSLRMVGTLFLNNALWGLVKANDGTIHRVHAGNYMGRNFGKIVRVREDQIELIEIIPDSPGAWRERKASLDLTEASGERK